MPADAPAGFGLAETDACRPLVELALTEDLGPGCNLAADATSALLPAALVGRAVFTARSPGVLAGLPVVALVAEAVDGRLSFKTLAADGDTLAPGRELAVIAGPMASLLVAERTALNFLQRLSGVATLTRRYVDAVAGLKCRILDTRKTTPGYRLLEKYAVRMGGGQNHRMGLYDGVLIKDNHLAALGPDAAGLGRPEAVARAVALARQAHGTSRLVEVEVDTLEQFDAAIAAGPDVVLLDNMPPEVLREAVRRRDGTAPGVLLEASGGVNLQTIRPVAESGVDRVSIGALTHSAPALDIGLDWRR